MSLELEDRHFEEEELAVVNPIKQAREDRNYLLKQFSRQIGVTSQLLYLVERGCYNSIPIKVLNFFEESLDVDPSSLEREYRRYQCYCRQVFGESVRWDLWSELPVGECSPFEELRNALDVSRVGFAKRMCLQPGLLYRLENAQMKTLPKHFTWAFRDAYLSDVLVGELDERVSEWWGLCHR